MPLYAYQCASCEAMRDEFNRVDERESNAPVCCERPMQQRIVLQRPIIRGNWDNYQSPLTGKVVQSARQRKREMDEANVIDAREVDLAGKREKYLEGFRERERLAAQMPKPTPDFNPLSLRD